jgi:hypothetical protein
MNNEAGGSAYPHENHLSHRGMSLRDYFAAKALEVAIQQVKDYYGVDKDAVALWCYDMADAMLKARNG